MNPLFAIIPIVVALLSKKGKRPSTQQPKEGTFRPQIVIVDQCHGWSIPDSWWERVALPRYSTLIRSGERDAERIVYHLLDDETGLCPLPPSLSVQVDTPGADKFWGGSPQMLYLAQHVAEVVNGALEIFEKDGTIALPVLELGES